MGHFRRTRFQIRVRAVPVARKGRGRRGWKYGDKRKNVKGNKSRAGFPTQRRAWKMSFHFLPERRDLRCAVAGNTRVSSARVMTGKKNDLLTPLPPWPFPPPLHRCGEQGGEATSIWPIPGGAPLKDKTTTISLCFPASHCLFWPRICAYFYFFSLLQFMCYRSVGAVRESAWYANKSTIIPAEGRGRTRNETFWIWPWTLREWLRNQSSLRSRSCRQWMQAGHRACQRDREKGRANLGSDFPFGRSSITVFPFHFIWFHMFHRAIYFILRVGVASIFIFKPLGPGADTGWPLF